MLCRLGSESFHMSYNRCTQSTSATNSAPFTLLWPAELEKMDERSCYRRTDGSTLLPDHFPPRCCIVLRGIFCCAHSEKVLWCMLLQHMFSTGTFELSASKPPAEQSTTRTRSGFYLCQQDREKHELSLVKSNRPPLYLPSTIQSQTVARYKSARRSGVWRAPCDSGDHPDGRATFGLFLDHETCLFRLCKHRARVT